VASQGAAGLGTVDDLGRLLGAAVGGEAVHEHRVRLGRRHDGAVHLERFQVGLAFRHLLLGDVVAHPRVRVHDVRALGACGSGVVNEGRRRLCQHIRGGSVVLMVRTGDHHLHAGQLAAEHEGVGDVVVRVAIVHET